LPLHLWLLLAKLISDSPSAVALSLPLGSESAFVHLFEWSWSDIAQECEDWLGPKGFSAVQISPPSEHIQGPQWWTRYQPVTYNLTSRSGDEAALVDMMNRCAKVGVSIYVDAVINHVAAGSGVGISGSPYGNRQTPLYSQEDFHHLEDPSKNCGVDNFQDQHNVQYCDLEGLPDLCTGCEKVQLTVAQYLSHLKSIGAAGFRVDAAKHQDAAEFHELLEKVDGGVPYVFQEVQRGGVVVPEMYTSIGQVTEFNYADQLSPNILAHGKMKYLQTFGESWGFLNSSKSVVFIDNHDTQRGAAQLTYKSGDIYNFANIFMLAHPFGYPKVMSSYYFNGKDDPPPNIAVHSSSGVACGEGHPWVCEHRRPEIANMVTWRKAAGAALVSSFVASDDGEAIAFCRGNGACIAMNRGNSPWSVRLSWTLPAGTYKDVLRGPQAGTVEVDKDGSVQLQVASLNAIALHVDARLDRSWQIEFV